MNHRRIPFLPTLAAIAALVAPCNADDDGAYGRLVGDLAWQLDLAAALGDSTVRPAVAASTRYLDTAGVYLVSYDPTSATREAAIGVELRPLFLPRFLQNLEHGPPVLDLAVDSFSLRFGTVFQPRHRSDWSTPGVELAALLGVPLTSHAPGPWLRLAGVLHLPPRSPGTQPGPPTNTLLVLAFSWQAFADAGLVDLTDRTPR